MKRNYNCIAITKKTNQCKSKTYNDNYVSKKHVNRSDIEIFNKKQRRMSVIEANNPILMHFSRFDSIETAEHLSIYWNMIKYTFKYEINNNLRLEMNAFNNNNTFLQKEVLKSRKAIKYYIGYYEGLIHTCSIHIGCENPVLESSSLSNEEEWKPLYELSNDLENQNISLKEYWESNNKVFSNQLKDNQNFKLHAEKIKDNKFLEIIENAKEHILLNQNYTKRIVKAYAKQNQQADPTYLN